MKKNRKNEFIQKEMIFFISKGYKKKMISSQQKILVIQIIVIEKDHANRKLPLKKYM